MKKLANLLNIATSAASLPFWGILVCAGIASWTIIKKDTYLTFKIHEDNTIIFDQSASTTETIDSGINIDDYIVHKIEHERYLEGREFSVRARGEDSVIITVSNHHFDKETITQTEKQSEISIAIPGNARCNISSQGNIKVELCKLYK